MSTKSFRTNVLLRSEQTDGQLSVIENTVPAGWEGPPLHHHDFDETFYVLEGELTFRLGDDVFTRGAGELAFAPGGVPHAFANRSNQPARFLLTMSPPGHDRYFDELAEILAVDGPPDPEAIADLRRRYDTQQIETLVAR
jgi:quercetin dioxygenase-like cupin family protein